MKIILLCNPNPKSISIYIDVAVSFSVVLYQRTGNTNFLIAAQKFLISFNFLFSSPNRISREGVLLVSLSPFRQRLTDVLYLVTQLNGLAPSQDIWILLAPWQTLSQRSCYGRARTQGFLMTKKKLSFPWPTSHISQWVLPLGHQAV